MRIIKILAILLAVLVVLAGALILIIPRIDFAQYRKPLESYVSGVTGRLFTINGVFEPVLSLTPTIRATDVRFANAEWADSADMAVIDEIYIRLRLWSLFSGPVRVIRLQINGGELHLQRNADGADNWSFGSSRPGKVETGSDAGHAFVTLREVDVSDTKLFYRSPDRQKPFDATINRLRLASPDIKSNEISLDATIAGQPLRAEGTIPGLRQIVRGRADHTLQIEYRGTKIASRFEIEDFHSLKGLDGNIDVSGQQLETLTSFLGFAKLDQGAFDVSSSLKEKDGRIDFDGQFKTQSGTITATGVLSDWRTQPAVAAQIKLDIPELLPLAQYHDLPLKKGGRLEANGGVSWSRTKLGFSGLTARFDSNTLSLDGDLGLPVRPENTTLKIRSAGPNIADALALFGIEYGIGYDFDLSADFSSHDDTITMQPFTLRLGENDFAGRIDVVPGQKPSIVATLKSEKIMAAKYLADRNQGDVSARKSDRVFNNDPFDFSFLDKFDGTLNLAADSIYFENIDLQNVSFKLAIENGSLQVEPFAAEVNGGPLTGRLRLDRNRDSPLFQIEMKGDKLRFGVSDQMGPEVTSALPPITLESRVKASGNSLHEMAVSSDGWIKMASEAGRRPKGSFGLFTNDLLTQVYYALRPTAKREDQHTLGCGIYYLRLDEGEARLQPFLLQTDTITLRGRGRLKMEDETLDIDFAAKPRKGIGVSVASIASPFLSVKGTLSDPKIRPNVAGGIVSGAAAFFTGGLSVLGKGIVDRATGGRDLCDDIDKILDKYREGEDTDAIWEN
jgi:uncharacterized protein involved in outer membrane biogenesis